MCRLVRKRSDRVAFGLHVYKGCSGCVHSSGLFGEWVVSMV